MDGVTELIDAWLWPRSAAIVCRVCPIIPLLRPTLPLPPPQTMNMNTDVGWGGFLGVWRQLVAAGGWRSLYDGLEPLLFREVPFQLTKFIVYDAAQSAIFGLLPAAKEALGTSLAVSFFSGLVAGVAGAVVGCPADAVMVRLSCGRGA